MYQILEIRILVPMWSWVSYIWSRRLSFPIWRGLSSPRSSVAWRLKTTWQIQNSGSCESSQMWCASLRPLICRFATSPASVVRSAPLFLTLFLLSPFLPLVFQRFLCFAVVYFSAKRELWDLHINSAFRCSCFLWVCWVVAFEFQLNVALISFSSLNWLCSSRIKNKH